MGHSEAIKQVAKVDDAVQFTIPNKNAIKLAKYAKLNEYESSHLRECFVVADKKYHKIIEKKIKLIPNYFKGQPTSVNFISNEKLIAEITIPMSVVLGAEDNKITSFKNLVNGDDVKVNISLKNRTMNLRIAPYGVVWLKL